MAVYLFNISVDTADPSPDYLPEDLSINDQESFVELILEKVLGYENAIKEYDDPDAEEHTQQENTKIECLLLPSRAKENACLAVTEKGRLYLDHTAPLSSGFREIDSPPPKA